MVFHCFKLNLYLQCRFHTWLNYLLLGYSCLTPGLKKSKLIWSEVTITQQQTSTTRPGLTIHIITQSTISLFKSSNGCTQWQILPGLPTGYAKNVTKISSKFKSGSWTFFLWHKSSSPLTVFIAICTIKNRFYPRQLRGPLEGPRQSYVARSATSFQTYLKRNHTGRQWWK